MEVDSDDHSTFLIPYRFIVTFISQNICRFYEVSSLDVDSLRKYSCGDTSEHHLSVLAS